VSCHQAVIFGGPLCSQQTRICSTSVSLSTSDPTCWPRQWWRRQSL